MIVFKESVDVYKQGKAIRPAIVCGQWHGAVVHLKWVSRYLLLVLALLIAHTGYVSADLAGCDEALRPASDNSGTMTFILALDGLSVPDSVPGLDNPQRLAAGLKFKVATNFVTTQTFFLPWLFLYPKATLLRTKIWV